MEVCPIHHRELYDNGSCKDCQGPPKPTIESTHISELELAVEQAWNQFEKFQQELLYKRPENWLQDIELIDRLKKQIGQIYNQLVGLHDTK